MAADQSRREDVALGRWLEGQIRARGMTLTDFAGAVGVSLASVSRWVHGRIPRGDYVERIADVLVLDYDELATRMGYRPIGIGEIAPGSPEAILLPYIRRVQWSEDRLDSVKAILQQMVVNDERRKR